MTPGYHSPFKTGRYYPWATSSHLVNHTIIFNKNSTLHSPYSLLGEPLAFFKKIRYGTFMNQGDQIHYREVLTNELEQRCNRNSRYSLRSFARDLAISPARLSDVMRGRYGLSATAALQIAKKLGWSERESQHFCDLVDAEHARSAQKKREAVARLRLSSAQAHHKTLSLDSFKVISDWYHYAILELLEVEGFQPNPTWIGTRLGISPHSCKMAIERLLRLGLMKKVGSTLIASDEFTTTTHDIPSESIKKFHRQILEKALLAIDFQDVDERDHSSLIVAIDPSCVAEAKESIKSFRRKFNKDFGSMKKKKTVYCLGVQFFNLEQK